MLHIHFYTVGHKIVTGHAAYACVFLIFVCQCACNLVSVPKPRKMLYLKVLLKLSCNSDILPYWPVIEYTFLNSSSTFYSRHTVRHKHPVIHKLIGFQDNKYNMNISSLCRTQPVFKVNCSDLV